MFQMMSIKLKKYPDADFAGMYGHENHTDPACAKSRTGFIITFADCPVYWRSKLQTETALSMMEAKIIALSACCRELFPIIDMVRSMAEATNLPVGDTTMNVSIHEDNLGALVLAKTLPPQFTPRSKYYVIKTIWFCEEIVKRGIKLNKIDTVEQLGDIFTKGLTRVVFEYLRKKIMGWQSQHSLKIPTLNIRFQSQEGVLYQIINLVLYYRVIGVKVPLVYSILNSNT
jgi:hypothetical protein